MGELCECGLVSEWDGVAVVDVEAGVFPGERRLDAFPQHCNEAVHNQKPIWIGRVLFQFSVCIFGNPSERPLLT